MKAAERYVQPPRSLQNSICLKRRTLSKVLILMTIGKQLYLENYLVGCMELRGLNILFKNHALHWCAHLPINNNMNEKVQKCMWVHKQICLVPLRGSEVDQFLNKKQKSCNQRKSKLVTTAAQIINIKKKKKGRNVAKCKQPPRNKQTSSDRFRHIEAPHKIGYFKT